MRIISFVFFFIFTISFCSSKLIFTQILFRHGARAPSERLTDPAYYESFPRGLGELTDRGFENSHRLGQFLKKRYVDDDFLDSNLKPSQMYWRSVNKNRCLSSAATVGAAMFEDPIRHLHVPVSTEELYEVLLNYNQKACPREKEQILQACPEFKGIYHPWPMFEEFVANCLNYTHPVFKTFPFHTLEAYINEYKNGMPLPPLIAQHINEIMGMYVNVTQFITGTGNHHNPDMMRIKFGRLMTTLIGNIENAVEEHKRKKSRMRFVAYSTQDWILMGVLDSFGVLEQTVGLDLYPEYNSMIINELYVDDAGNYSIKLFYKAEEITDEDHQLIDATKFVRNCPNDEEYCPFEKFIGCCQNYTVRRVDPCTGNKLDPDDRRRSVKRVRRSEFTMVQDQELAGPE